MSERFEKDEDINDIVTDMASFDEEEEVAVPLFQNAKIEVPFQTPSFESQPTYSFNTPVYPTDDECTVIGASTIIDGDIVCGGNIYIKGQVKGKLTVAGVANIYGSVEGDIEANEVILHEGTITGNVVCKTDLTVSLNAQIIGDVVAKNASFDANLKGNIKTFSELRLSSTAVITGDIVTGNISVANGAVINGQLSIKR